MKKRLLSFAVVMAMASALVPVIGSAEEVDVTDAQLGIEAESFEYEQKILEDERQSSNRFIVKYKDSAQGNKENLVASSKHIYRKLKAEKQNRRSEWEKHISAENLERLQLNQNTRKAKAYATREVDTNQLSEEQPEVETIELAESVNAEQFVAEMEQAMGDKIEYIQPDVQMETSSIDTASLVSAVVDRETNLSQALETATGAGVTVALIDSGVDVTHEGLQNNLVTGWDFFNDKELTYSEEESSNSMHGTHIAGIIAQTAPEAKIMPLKVFQYGKAYTSDIIRAIEYAEASGADIVNCSWGNSAENPALKEVMENSDMFFVAAVGNGRINLDETPVYPASYGLDNIINVTSVNQDGGMSYYSNYGESVDIAAWGRDVYSTMPNNEYGEMTGTSMSAGYVTGAAALALSNGTGISELKYVLKSGADKASSLDGKVENGNMLNFANTVYGVTPQEVTYVDYADDFDRWAEKTPEENWQLFNSSKNVDIAIRGATSFILKEDGSVWMTATNNYYSQNGASNKNIRQVTGLKDIIKISAKGSIFLALDSKGEVYTETTYIIPSVLMKINGLNDIIDFDCGHYGGYSLAVKADGTVWKWPKDNTPISKVSGLTDVKKVVAGYDIYLALKNDGSVWIWADYMVLHKCTQFSNVKTIMEDPETETYKVVINDGTAYSFVYNTRESDYIDKISIVELSDVCDVAYADTFLKNDGTVWRKGDNEYGQLGNGTIEDSETYVKVNLDRKIEKVCSNGETVVAIDEFGYLWSWGSNLSLSALQFPYVDAYYYPIKILGISNVKYISTNWSGNAFVKDDGTVWTVGSTGTFYENMYYGNNERYSSTPRQVRMTDVKEVKWENQHTIALKNDGTLWGWGTNRYGQMGSIKSSASEKAPVKLEVENVRSYSTSFDNTFAIKENGTVWAWGSFQWDGMESILPTQIQDIDGIVQVSATQSHYGLLLKNDGTVWAWVGPSSDGTIRKPMKVNGISNVKKLDRTLALKEDGTVWNIECDDYKTYFYAEQIENITNVKNIGHDHNCAFFIKEDGTVWGLGTLYWPDGKHEKKDTPTQIEGLQNIVACEGGLGNYIALDADGYVWAWGRNDVGQCGDGSLLYITSPTRVDGEINDFVYILHVAPLPDIEVAYGTPVSALNLPSQVTVILDNGEPEFLNVTWDTSAYNPTQAGEYTIYGDIELVDGIINPNNLPAEVKVIIPGPLHSNIKSIPAIQKSIQQYMPLGPTEKDHSLGGVPNTVDLPETVGVVLDNPWSGTTTPELPVIWNLEEYKPYLTGKQTITGEVQLPGMGIQNPDNLKATAEIEVTPAECYLWEIDTAKEFNIEVYPNTTVEEINEMLVGEEIAINAEYAEGDFAGDTLCIYSPFSIDKTAPGNIGFDPAEPGYTYTLLADLPENIWDFYGFFEDVPDDMKVKVNVTVKEPLAITGVTDAFAETYQCLDLNDEHHEIPAQVTVTLEDGSTALVDVVWNTASYNPHVVGSQFVTGELVNLPNHVKQPEDTAFTGKLIVDVTPVKYEIAEVVSIGDLGEGEDIYETYAGLTLAELLEAIENKITVRLQSTTEGLDISTEHEIVFTLEEEKNSQYEPFIADLYILEPTLALPDNISNADNLFSEVLINTNAVNASAIGEIENVVVNEGTEFADITLPSTVTVQLDNGKTAELEVDWGDGEGYNPYPPGLTPENPAEFRVTGSFVNLPQYINVPEFNPEIKVTVIYWREYYIQSITPSRIPETGAKEVNLGLSLEDIYKDLETRTVTLNLISNRDEELTLENVAFKLREEDNAHYDPLALDTYELIGYLELEENIKNPDGHQVTVSVQTMSYTISSAKAVRVTGVIAGTPFAEIGLPEQATATYTSGKKEDLPVEWIEGNYNPNKIGSQAVKGNFSPLPVHVQNPNHRQVSAAVTIVNPDVKILSATQVIENPMLRMAREDEILPGFTERKYEVELQHKDGSITTEIISVFEEIAED